MKKQVLFYLSPLPSFFDGILCALDIFPVLFTEDRPSKRYLESEVVCFLGVFKMVVGLHHLLESVESLVQFFF